MSRPAARAVRTGAETWTRIRSSSILRGGVEVGGVLRVEEVVAPEPGGECVRTHALATQRPCEGCRDGSGSGTARPVAGSGRSWSGGSLRP